MADFQIVSDLHLESPPAYDIFDIPVKAPDLALLGDIGSVNHEGFFSFIKAQLYKYQIVFFLFGNHEPYHSSWTETRRKINDFAQGIRQEPELGEFVFLDRTRYDISDEVTVLGCTLYSHVQPEQQDMVSMGLNDFYYIDDWTVEAHNAAHREDLAWLNDQVASISISEPGKKVVIFTHHSPVVGDSRAVDPNHVGSSITSGFATDLSNEECWENVAVCLWAFGHTHFNCDFITEGEGGKKRVTANQRGYYFKQTVDFDVEKVVSV